MDTRFWGPDGWRLLHLITENYPDNASIIEKNNYKFFFKSLPYVLPCIYCRKSLHKYMHSLPIDNYLNSRNDLCKWLYLIHNQVNNKLRMQGLNDKPDPPFEFVKKKYEIYLVNLLSQNCIGMPGWNFIYTIMFNYPLVVNQIEYTRYLNYIIFIKYLGKVIPFPIIKNKYLEITSILEYNVILLSRENLTKWFHSTEKEIRLLLDCKCTNYSDRCKIIEKYRAGCGNGKDIKPTCRTNNSK